MKNNLQSQVEEILSRSVAEILPLKESLKDLLLSGKKLKIYTGADATGPQLHIGHATNFILLEKLRQLGHEVVILFGDFTAMIGDPTDKTAARVRLTREEVDENIKSWKKQVSRIINFNDKKNPAKIVKNSVWLSKLNFSDLVDVSSNFTVQRMLERDMFEKRIREEKPIYLHEFLYPLMQGYDSVHLDVDLEIGGTDQTFNMLAGRTLQKRYNNKEKYVLSTTLLVNPVTGKKLMSKSEGGFIALNDSLEDMFGKVMALPDQTIIQVFIDCTYVPLSDIKKMESDMAENKLNPRDAKLALAHELVKMFHSEKEADKAEENFLKVFSNREIPEQMPEIVINESSISLFEILRMGISTSELSSSEIRRLISQKSIKINDKSITDPYHKVKLTQEGVVIKIGKRRWLKAIGKI